MTGKAICTGGTPHKRPGLCQAYVVLSRAGRPRWWREPSGTFAHLACSCLGQMTVRRRDITAGEALQHVSHCTKYTAEENHPRRRQTGGATLNQHPESQAVGISCGHFRKASSFVPESMCPNRDRPPMWRARAMFQTPDTARSVGSCASTANLSAQIVNRLCPRCSVGRRSPTRAT